jgi:hypothetical protein
MIKHSLAFAFVALGWTGLATAGEAPIYDPGLATASIAPTLSAPLQSRPEIVEENVLAPVSQKKEAAGMGCRHADVADQTVYLTD